MCDECFQRLVVFVVLRTSKSSVSVLILYVLLHTLIYARSAKFEILCTLTKDLVAGKDSNLWAELMRLTYHLISRVDI
jgi:hypothetical protein